MRVSLQMSSQLSELSRRLPVELVGCVEQLLQFDADKRPTAKRLTLVSVLDADAALYWTFYQSL